MSGNNGNFALLMKNVLILLAHPNYGESKANKFLAEKVKGLPGVTMKDLYSEPFTVENYLEAFRNADVLVFQFPFYWGSAPSMLKKWLDEIFMALFDKVGVKGKQLLVVTTTGSEYEAYRSGGRDRFTMDELLRPYEFTALYAGMDYLTPLVVYSTAAPDAQKYIEEGAEKYVALLEKLVG